ncbi:MAG: hypothetical protein ACLFQX_12450 [Candidatus Kapaibacterium sp.]
MQNNEILSRRQMEEMLPDYVFGRLGDDEYEAFERSIGHYPDLENEIRDVRSVFSRAESMDIDGMFKSKSRNMSVKVRQRREQQRAARPAGNVFFRFVLPTAGLVAIVALMLFNPFGNPEPAPIALEPIMTHAEAISLIDGDSEPAELAHAEAEIAAPVIEQGSLGGVDLSDDQLDDLDHEFTEYIAELAAEASQPLFEDFSYEELNTLSEDEFQKIIEELEDVDFNS